MAGIGKKGEKFRNIALHFTIEIELRGGNPYSRGREAGVKGTGDGSFRPPCLLPLSYVAVVCVCWFIPGPLRSVSQILVKHNRKGVTHAYKKTWILPHLAYILTKEKDCFNLQSCLLPLNTFVYTAYWGTYHVWHKSNKYISYSYKRYFLSHLHFTLGSAILIMSLGKTSGTPPTLVLTTCRLNKNDENDKWNQNDCHSLVYIQKQAWENNYVTSDKCGHTVLARKSYWICLLKKYVLLKLTHNWLLRR